MIVPRRTLLAVLAGATVVLAAGCSTESAPPTPAPQQAAEAQSVSPGQPGSPSAPQGYLQLGHLAPQAPPFHGYFALFGEDGKLIGSGGYGAMGPYMELPPGRYVWSMRPVDSPPDSPLTLTKLINVEAGQTSSVLLFNNGPDGALQGVVTDEDTSAPPPGMGKLRVVQGAAGAPLPITIGDRPVQNMAYGTVTSYQETPAGRVTVQSPEAAAPLSIDVAPGSLMTVLVTRNEQGVQLAPVSDSIPGPAAAPAGPPTSVNTGSGGQASALPTPAVIGPAAGAVLIGVVVAIGLARRRAH